MRSLSAAVLALAAAGCLAAAPAASGDPVEPGDAATAPVADFVAAYRDAVLGLGESGHTPSEVRADRLTPELNARLDAWAAQHPADPVFRTAEVPESWTVRAEGAAGGLAFALVTERFGPAAAVHRVRYAVRRDDRAIVDLMDAPG
ncbi:hypothetical protein [Kitasatospora sp. NPDC059571]|uniref:hypothetical protein n=1 Tax=Kitasatospora sp. NPDC059571 TaxID=3346871 RepID=UPI003678DB15